MLCVWVPSIALEVVQWGLWNNCDLAQLALEGGGGGDDARHLSRIIRSGNHRITWEGSPRRVQILARD